MISQIINSKDYPVIIISILKNSRIYSLIDEEYSKNKTTYDEKALKSGIFKNKEFDIIPESMVNYAIKLTGILLSPNGEWFLNKILQEGWPQLYAYIKNSNKIIYDKIAKVKGYQSQGLDNYLFYIVILLCMIFEKKVYNETNEGKIFIQNFDKWRMSIIGDSPDLNELYKINDEDCQKTLVQMNQENILENRLVAEKNKNMVFALYSLLESYNISLNDEIAELSISGKLEENDKELLNIYTVCSQNSFNDILSSDIKKRDIADFIITARFLQGLIKKYKILYKEYMKLYKISLINEIDLNNKIEQQKKTNEKLISENQELKEELRKMKEEQNKHEAQEIIKIKRQYESSIQEMADTIERYKEENEALKTVIEDLLQGNHYANEEQIINDIPKVTKGVIIGGSPQWQQNMKSIVPHYKFIEANELNYDTKILENAERIYFNTAYCSHALFYKTINIVRKKKLDILFINNNSVTAGFKMFGQKSGQYTDKHLVS